MPPDPKLGSFFRLTLAYPMLHVRCWRLTPSTQQVRASNRIPPNFSHLQTSASHAHSYGAPTQLFRAPNERLPLLLPILPRGRPTPTLKYPKKRPHKNKSAWADFSARVHSRGLIAGRNSGHPLEKRSLQCPEHFALGFRSLGPLEMLKNKETFL